MKILCHPLHIMLVHFPTALLPMDLICGVLGIYTPLPELTYASFYSMIGGIVTGWLAIIFGVLDLSHISNKKPRALNTALIHGGINLFVIFAYTVIGYLAIKQFPASSPNGTWLLAVKAVLITFMFIGNFLGGRLILKHRVAVEGDLKYEN